MWEWGDKIAWAQRLIKDLLEQIRKEGFQDPGRPVFPGGGYDDKPDVVKYAEWLRKYLAEQRARRADEMDRQRKLLEGMSPAQREALELIIIVRSRRAGRYAGLTAKEIEELMRSPEFRRLVQELEDLARRLADYWKRKPKEMGPPAPRASDDQRPPGLDPRSELEKAEDELAEDPSAEAQELLKRLRRLRRDVEGERRFRLSERDPQWPQRGQHETEAHHPLMKGNRFRDFWRQWFTDEEIEKWTVDLDTDIHRAISESGWWDAELLRRIQEAQARKGNVKLTKDEVLRIVKRLLDEVVRLSEAARAANGR